MHSSQLIKQVKNYAKTLLEENLPKEMAFHNVNHTVQVVEQCKLLVSYCNLPDMDKNALLIAAWFHDTGYCRGNINHEEESVKIAFEFLKGWDVTSEYRSKVQRLIMATQLPTKPVTLIDEILCDADMHHLGSPNYEAWSHCLKKELEHSGLIQYLTQSGPGKIFPSSDVTITSRKLQKLCGKIRNRKIFPGCWNNKISRA